MRVFPEYADIFTFDMLDGSADKLKEPNMVLLPLSLSNKLFGNQSAVGKQLHMVNSNGDFHHWRSVSGFPGITLCGE